jgi:hypothetical protein
MPHSKASTLLLASLVLFVSSGCGGPSLPGEGADASGQTTPSSVESTIPADDGSSSLPDVAPGAPEIAEPDDADLESDLPPWEVTEPRCDEVIGSICVMYGRP